jgi:cytoskeleton protein RodZ
MVENFGLHLKHERELRGVSLEEIAESTRIHIRFLEALESNDLDQLPGEVFIKGYIRSYARVIGFDSEEMVNVYDESVSGNRKEEPEKVATVNDKAPAGKNRVAGYIFGGAALAAIVWLGYPALEKIIDTNKKQQDDRLLASEPSPNIEETPVSAETSVPEKVEIEVAENSNEEASKEQPLKETLQKTAAPVETKTRPEPTVEKQSPPAPAVSMAPVTQAEVEKEQVREIKPEPPVQSSEPEEDEQEIRDIDSEIAVNPSRPQEDKKAEPKTPIESAVMEKNPTSEEKPVIIQQVMENAETPPAPDQSVSEPDAKPLHLRIRVQGNSWFNVTVDDSNEEDFILPGGSSKNIYGTEKIQLTIGNRNGTELFLNERPIDLPAGSNDVIRNFDITANLLE